MSLIVCVTTYNRAEMLGRQLESLRSLASTAFELVVCDDGSSDDSVAVAEKAGAIVVKGKNRGIAFNKNRGLFYATQLSTASHILLLDDDTFAKEAGWEQEWLRAIDLHGHINHAPPTVEPLTVYGRYTPESPAVSTGLSGQCLGFDRRLLARLGFMDTRYGRYGGEHVDLSLRAVRLGYGGFFVGTNALWYSIKGGLRVEGAPSSGTPEDIERAGTMFHSLMHESIYRPAWHTEALYEDLMADMAPWMEVQSKALEDPGLSRLRCQMRGRYAA